MRILERYINHSIFKIFTGTIFIFCFLYVLIDITSNLDDIIEHKTNLETLAQYYASYLPIILVQTSPIACLIAALLTYSGMNNTNEIIAMRSSGMNFWQMTKPGLCFGLLVSALVFMLNERCVPQAMQVSRQIRDENMISNADQSPKKKAKIRNLTFYGLKNRLYFIDTYHPQTSELEGITIIEYDEGQNIKQKIVALSGQWTGITGWKFSHCQVTPFDRETFNAPVKVKVYDEKLMDIKETPDDFMKQRLNVDSMNTQQLSSYIARFSNSGATKALNNLRVDLHQKIAYPIGNFVIVLVGIPFALMVKSRKGLTFTSLGMAVTIGFLYYVVNAVMLAFGKGGLFPPILSAWAAPLIFTGIALVVIENNF